MRIFSVTFFLLFCLGVNTTVAQEITGFVNDHANILGPEKQQIEQIAQQLYDANLVQIAIVTVDSLNGQPIEDVAFNLAEDKLGTQDNDNGLLLLIAVEERSYRFEVGRGLEPIFNDAKVGRYGRELLVPAFQTGEYGQGVLLVMNEINQEVTGQRNEDLPVGIDEGSLENTPTQAQAIIFLFFVLFFLLLFFVIYTTAIRKKVLPGKRGSHDDRYFLAALLASRMMRRGGGGGFGGFGGGSFGGGGASGKF